MSTSGTSPSSAGSNSDQMTQQSSVSGGESHLFAAIPLKYTYLIKSNSSHYLYESNNGLWQEIDPANSFINSQIPSNQALGYRIIDNFSSLRAKLTEQEKEHLAVCDSRGNEHLVHLTIKSNESQTVQQHARLLQNYNKVDFKTLLIDRGKFKNIFTNNQIALDFKQLLDELSAFCGVEILISNRVEYFNLSMNPNVQNDIIDQNIYVYIIGDSDDTIFTETRLRILLDNYLNLFVDSVEIPLSLIPLIGGVSFADFRAIAKETGVNIYLPTILPELYSNSRKHDLDVIYLSGMQPQVLLAKNFMNDIIEKRKPEILYKNIDVLKYKKDAVLLNYKDDLSSIMYKYGVYIQLAPLGVDESTVHFQGNSSELIERAITDFTSLTNAIFFASIWFHKDSLTSGSISDHEPAELQVTIDELQDFIARISVASNVSIYNNQSTSSFEFWGGQEDTLKAIKLFNSYSKQLFKDFKSTMSFKIELGLSYHEFISGKKNGKISKIMNNFKTSTINFEPLNEYSLLVELRSIDFADFLNSYDQLQNEFPSEVRFYIPEAFHRQIIGTGGSLIQSIMRKYNVFIKFSNSYDLKNNYKSHTRYDNVIVRCPAKNSSNIPLVKNELNSLLINNENTTFFNTFFKLSRNQYRLFSFDKIQQIEKKTSTFARFPSTEPTDFAIVEVLGTENHSVNATKLFINELAESYEFKITFSKKFHNVINDTHEAFVEKIKIPFKILYNFEIMGTDKKTEDSVPYHSILLTYLPESDLYLEDAITHLTSFLREYEFMIIDRGELSNNDSIIQGSASRYTQLGSNFNNKLNNPNIPKSQGSATAFDTSFPRYPFPQNNSLPLHLPQSQQLYQLPNIPDGSVMSQPTLVQPLGIHKNDQTNLRNGQFQTLKKRPATHNGHDNVINRQNFYQRRPY